MSKTKKSAAEAEKLTEPIGETEINEMGPHSDNGIDDAQDSPEKNISVEKNEKACALDAENEDLKQKLKEANDKYLRVLAEFDNARKRSEKERLETFGNASVRCVSELLPFIDAFDRAITAECGDEKYKSGMEMIYSQLKGCLTKIGVSEIEALGKPFDPQLHNAIKQIESDEFDESTVCEVYQKGYKLGDKVIRYAMVVVAN